MNKLLACLAFFSTILFSSCDSVSPELPADLYIVSGQNFGFCIGSCHQTMTLNTTNTEADFFVKTTEYKGNNGTTKEDNYTDNLSEIEWEAILNAIDIETFKTLDEVYGCPDCADGGSEWVELIEGDNVYRVTFEYGEEVKEIKNLILLLRKKRIALSEKYVTTE